MKTQARHWRLALGVGLFVMIVVDAPGVTGVFAGDAVGDFEIDGNLVDSPSGGPIDWSTDPAGDIPHPALPNRVDFTDASGQAALDAPARPETVERVLAALAPGALPAAPEDRDALQKWFRRDLREYLGDHLLAPSARLGQYLDAAYVRVLCEEHLSGRADHSHRLWTLLTSIMGQIAIVQCGL